MNRQCLTPVSYTHLDVYKRQAVETETIVPETAEKPAEAPVVEKAADTPSDAPKPASEADKPEGEADKAEPDDKSKTDEFSWPDDWRERIAGEDAVSYTHLDVYKRQP